MEWSGQMVGRMGQGLKDDGAARVEHLRAVVAKWMLETLLWTARHRSVCAS